MLTQDLSNIHVDCDRFLYQVIAHHRRGDHYPDPLVIGQELGFTSGQTDRVLAGLGTLRWVAQSPYGPERIRLTPRCWTFLHQMSEPAADAVPAVPADASPFFWQSIATEPCHAQ